MVRVSGKSDGSPGRTALEWLVLLVLLAVLAIRGTYTESPQTPNMDPAQFTTNGAISLLLSSGLLLAGLIWAVAALLRGRLEYRRTWMGPGVLLFLAAGAAGFLIASNRRDAMTNAVTLAAPMLAALVLVQLLGRPSRIRLLLMVVAGLGAANFSQSMEQFTSSNQMLIEQYEKDPAAQLQKVGIEPNSYNHMLYEHRLYSTDIRGFFKTSNTVGSFFLLALAACGALLFQESGAQTEDRGRAVFIQGILLLMILAGLLLTFSKGALAGTALAAMLLAAYWLFGEGLRRYRWIVLVLGALTAVGAAAAVIGYGTTHGTLPGGSSMLVRWQYWEATARMIGDHPFLGVGPGSFGSYYTHYKIPAALETVKDPHNVLLMLLAEYGPAGLLGFLAAVLGPLVWMLFRRPSDASPPERLAAVGPDQPRLLRPRALLVGVSLVAMLVVCRPWLIPAELSGSPGERLFQAFYLYGLPAGVFGIGFLILWLGSQYGREPTRFAGLSRASLVCGLLGVLAANQIDFALFEPGVWTAFWMLLAAVVAMHRLETGAKTPSSPWRASIRWPLLAGVLLAAVLYARFVLVDPLQAGVLIQQALRQAQRAPVVLERAALIDRLDPEPLRLKADFHVRQYDQTGSYGTRLLDAAVESLAAASLRDPADFGPFERIGDIHSRLAMVSPSREEEYGRAALGDYSAAIERYPGAGRLYYKRALMAEMLGRIDQALADYRTAVEIEQAYRRQFRVMYPGREVFSRLGEDKYRRAQKKIEQLSSQE